MRLLDQVLFNYNSALQHFVAQDMTGSSNDKRGGYLCAIDLRQLRLPQTRSLCYADRYTLVYRGRWCYGWRCMWDQDIVLARVHSLIMR